MWLPIMRFDRLAVLAAKGGREEGVEGKRGLRQVCRRVQMGDGL